MFENIVLFFSYSKTQEFFSLQATHGQRYICKNIPFIKVAGEEKRI